MTEEEYKNELVRLKKENQELKLQIKELNTDKLTRLDTRASGEKKFYNYFKSNVFENYTHTDGLALLFIDIDKFKQFNDNNGHLFGDKVLKTFADTLYANINPENGDILCRWGGDEFVALLNDIDHEESVIRANKIITDIRENDDLCCKLTASLGLLYINPDKLINAHALYQKNHKDASETTIDYYINEVDYALYKAKKNGRNQVYDYSDGLVDKEISTIKKLTK